MFAQSVGAAVAPAVARSVRVPGQAPTRKTPVRSPSNRAVVSRQRSLTVGSGRVSNLKRAFGVGKPTQRRCRILPGMVEIVARYACSLLRTVRFFRDGMAAGAIPRRPLA